MAKMSIDDVLNNKYLTDSSLAQQLVAGTLSLDDQIIKDHIHQLGAYQEIYSPGPEPTMVDVTIDHEDGGSEAVLLNPNETYSEQGYSGYYSSNAYDSYAGETSTQFLVDDEYPEPDAIIYDYCHDSYNPPGPGPEPIISAEVTIVRGDGTPETALLNPNETYSEQGYSGYYSQDTYNSDAGESADLYLVDNNSPQSGDTIYDYCNDIAEPEDPGDEVTVTIEHEDGPSETVSLNPNETYAEQGYAGYYKSDMYNSGIGETAEDYLVDNDYPSEGETIYDYCNDTAEPEEPAE